MTQVALDAMTIDAALVDGRLKARAEWAQHFVWDTAIESKRAEVAVAMAVNFLQSTAHCAFQANCGY
ncbi:MAG: hypothetical protein ABL307_05225 [Roseitalea porphyridii]|uniref:hypothetical protein n=1 Tax=Roseitalea porphyridii TaxID=1852022 RepID=UPI0032D8E0E8